MLEAAPSSQRAEASETCSECFPVPEAVEIGRGAEFFFKRAATASPYVINEGEVEEPHLNVSRIFFRNPFEETGEKHTQWITNGDFKKMTSKRELGLEYGYLGW